MRTTRLALTVATAAFAVAGCTADGTPATSATSAPAASAAAAPSASADPAAVQALSGAASTLGNSSFKMTMTQGSGFQLTADIDAPHGNGTAEMNAKGGNTALTVKTLLFGKDLYAQIPGVTQGQNWTHLDMARLPDGSNIGLKPGQIDPANTAQLLSSTTDVHRAGEGSYAGTVDLTKAAGVAGISKVTLDGYGADAKQVPFEATLDQQDRLESLTLRLPSVDSRETAPLQVKYSDYGQTVTAQRPPAGQISEAPDSVYQALGGK
ncbi:hypothetical protein ACWT_7404 [Actinoplanes sp. SE50]|uniref:LppX_LprAFG lipoprotein n=1 Tax=unclassified Actinoplanes TaxID=2626549 RepID=UPI00023EE057|nr:MULTISPECIES: LppX_LprAFG lipoprotein [unclassified Actinoplanes]AEV88414.1 hypothetical protein ACPL_7534 [Actinoplanes sp. SE50/110]ATO86819.1 hypothetical protein ACWT_7404 [Actinoplanes sp. SE50]SLM04237.1 uncharacterized protein ACSP50_7540 [Actinoplanes sp. SE50/110]